MTANHSFLTLRKGAKTIGNATPDRVLALRLCQVTAIDSSSYTCTVYVGAAPSGTTQTSRPKVAYLTSYAPSVGDYCWAIENGADLLIIGSASTQTGSQGVVPGEVKMYAGGTIPTGYLLCNGSAVSRTTYANLFAAIGTTWGAGDGSTTFNVPDARSRSPLCVGQGSGLSSRTLGTTGGEENHALAAAENGVHSHGGSTGNQNVLHYHNITTGTESASHTHNINGSGNTAFRYSSSTEHTASSGVSGVTFGTLDTESALHTHSGSTSTESVWHTHSIGSDGSGTAHNTMHPWIAFNFMIKT
jgi:microcystin-dependent protein